MCFVVYLRFPAVSRLVFDMFRCRPVGDGVRLLEANYQQECFEPEHWIFFCVGVFFLCAYTLGIPCFILYKLTSYKTTILGRPASKDYKPAVGKKGTDGYQPQVGEEPIPGNPNYIEVRRRSRKMQNDCVSIVLACMAHSFQSTANAERVGFALL
jgi:hypothetical protein